MFTGLIEEIGVVAGTVKSDGGILLTVGAVRTLEGTKKGDSISINGACQTVTSLAGGGFTVFVSSVTASVTALGSYKAGKRVNLERAMTPASRFGGHFVQGHADGTGRVKTVKRDPAGLGVEVSAGSDIIKYIVAKGSVAVDGISLTVVSVARESFSLYIIPETFTVTTASEWKPGDAVNIEVDIIAKYVERMMAPAKGSKNAPTDDGKLLKKIMEEGFF